MFGKNGNALIVAIVIEIAGVISPVYIVGFLISHLIVSD
jgi:hypothetical protein